MNVYYETNKGLMRENNEDNLIIEHSNSFNLYAVADGMGGHKAGEIASNIAIETVREIAKVCLIKDDCMPPSLIIKCVEVANDNIRQKSLSSEEFFGMGTTITIAIVDKTKNILYVGNIGDSRAYVIKDDTITQITDDHTYVNELIKLGKITIDEAKKHPKKNVITKALGSEEVVHADLFELEISKEDIFLLCTDGLTTHLSDRNILETLKKVGPENSVPELIKQANENGGTDNITVIIIHNIYRGDEYDR